MYYNVPVIAMKFLVYILIAIRKTLGTPGLIRNLAIHHLLQGARGLDRDTSVLLRSILEVAYEIAHRQGHHLCHHDAAQRTQFRHHSGEKEKQTGSRIV